MSTGGQHFGLILEGFGINITNKYNPEPLLKNCAFVTIAVLKGVSLVELGRLCRGGDGPCSLVQIIDTMSFTIQGHNQRRHSQRLMRIEGDSPNNEQIKGLVEQHTKVGIAYLRRWLPSSPLSGHCVVAEMSRYGKLRFMCYQHDVGGKDVTWDFRNAKSWGAFWFTSHGYQFQGTGFCGTPFV